MYKTNAGNVLTVRQKSSYLIRVPSYGADLWAAALTEDRWLCWQSSEVYRLVARGFVGRLSNYPNFQRLLRAPFQSWRVASPTICSLEMADNILRLEKAATSANRRAVMMVLQLLECLIIAADVLAALFAAFAVATLWAGFGGLPAHRSLGVQGAMVS